MTTEEPFPLFTGLLRLRVAVEADPQALTRVLERFQNLNILPRRVLAEFGFGDLLHVQVDVVGITEERLTLIAAKLNECPPVLSAYWHHA